MRSDKSKWIVDVRGRLVDPTCSHPLYKRFLEYAESIGADEDEHYFRNCQTLAAILSVVGDISLGQRIAETGGYGLISGFLHTSGYEIESIASDLRYPFLIEDDRFDIVFSLEVIEHIKDQMESSLADVVLFNYSGLKTYCKEVVRVLRPGGYLILTTPNNSSIKSIINALNYENSYIYKEHVREFTKNEIQDLFSSMTLIDYRTHFSFFMLDGEGLQAAQEICAKLGYGSHDRGDDHFFIFRK